MEEGRKPEDAERPMDLALRTRRFAMAIITLSRRISHGDDAGEVIRRQILRSGTSIGAQYREGRRARSTAEYVSKLEGALQELEETGYWLELLQDAQLVEAAMIQRFLTEVGELTCIFIQCVKNAKGEQ
jgi:four helix bundle protein